MRAELFQRGSSRSIIAHIVCILALLTVAGCAQPSTRSSADLPSVSCGEVAMSVIERVRVGATSGAIDSEIQWLSDNCDKEYEIAIEYASTASMAQGQFGPETCDVLVDRNFHAESVRLLRADGFCTDSGSTSSGTEDASPSQWPNDGLPWNQAVNYVGTTQRICGPLVSMRTSTDDVFLNIGRDYPDPERFTVVVWDIGGVEQESPGVTICVSGPVTSYNGVPQVELQTLDPIEVWN